MKLLLENWRNFVIFENIETATRLSIFDFDETIAFTTGVINVTDKTTGETFQTRTQEEYDEIKNDERYEFDFQEQLAISCQILIHDKRQVLCLLLAHLLVSEIFYLETYLWLFLPVLHRIFCS